MVAGDPETGQMESVCPLLGWVGAHGEDEEWRHRLHPVGGVLFCGPWFPGVSMLARAALLGHRGTLAGQSWEHGAEAAVCRH